MYGKCREWAEGGGSWQEAVSWVLGGRRGGGVDEGVRKSKTRRGCRGSKGGDE